MQRRKGWFVTGITLVFATVVLLGMLWTGGGIRASGSQRALAADLPDATSAAAPDSGGSFALVQPDDQVQNLELHIDPATAWSGAHYIFLFQPGTPVPLTGVFEIQFPKAQYDPNGDGDYSDSLLPDLDYPEDNPRLAQMLIS
jgi:hypothetical protein